MCHHFYVKKQKKEEKQIRQLGMGDVKVLGKPGTFSFSLKFSILHY